jgi:hypothetical protein
MEPTTTSTCLLCGAEASPALELPRFGGSSCERCARRLGRMLVQAPSVFTDVWPLLVDDEDPLEPEPRVQRADGSVVELRQLTAELKRDLTVEDRVRLVEVYGDIGLVREQLLECGQVLVESSVVALTQRALDVLFSPGLCSPLGLEELRGRLFPS